LAFVFLLSSAPVVLPWDKGAHREMATRAAGISTLPQYVQDQLGFAYSAKRFLGPAHTEYAYTPQEFGPDRYYTAEQWLIHGALAEDEFLKFSNPASLHIRFILEKNLRAVNHFYNPFWDNPSIYPYSDDGRGNDWRSQEGGLYDDIATGIADIDIWAGKPSPRWGYDGCGETPPVSNFTRTDDNVFSWTMARKYHYAAVSGNSTELDGVGGIVGKTRMDESERDRVFALLFRSLGQIMHLLQDAAEPEHTRNDAHPRSGVSGMEAHAETYTCTSPYCSTPIPWESIVKSGNPYFDFFDSNRSGGGYTPAESTGLAEFSTYNFYTKDSIVDNLMFEYCDPNCEPFGHERHRFFTSPRIGEDRFTLEPGRLYETYYYLSESIVDPLGIMPNQTIRLAKRKWYHNLLVLYGWRDYTTEDPKIWDDYFDLLFPKAIGYSAALLDYFFRGVIEVSPPDIGTYALTQDPDPSPGKGFTRVTLLARNASPDGEEMTDGGIELVVKYRLALDDPFRNYPQPVPTTWEFFYIVAPEATGIRSIPTGQPVKLEFDLQDNPIPLWATDVYLQVVYRGKLGLEDGAVAVGFKDISEPTPMDIVNNMDKICINNGWLDAGSPEAIAVVDEDENGIADPDEWDVYPHDLQDIYLGFFSVSACQLPSCTDDDLQIPYLAARDYVRIFVLSDDRFCLSHCAIPVVHTHPDDQFGFTYFGPMAWTFPGLKNQTETETDPAVCGQYGLEAPCYLRYFPFFVSLKGVERWDRLVFDNAPYPTGSSCSHDQLP
jgi:hypothetical protein